jgi:predicted nucleotidyltransferase
LAAGELDYLRTHWELLAELRAAIRTEPSVQMAILFGSMARGDGDANSDVDLLVEFKDEAPLNRLRLGMRLQEKIGREVDVGSLRQAEQRDPFFLLQALDEGRVIADRGARWSDLLDRRATIRKRAMRSYRRQQRQAAKALTSSQLRVQTARLAHRVESLWEHRIGLEQAAMAFGGAQMDPQAWQCVFDSHKPLDIVARNGLTGCYSTFVNNYVELLKTGAYLAGLTSHRRDHAKDIIELVRGDGGITKQQAVHLHELFVFEGRVQHASPDIDADEVREAVELLRTQAPALVATAIEWLKRRGVDIAAGE